MKKIGFYFGERENAVNFYRQNRFAEILKEDYEIEFPKTQCAESILDYDAIAFKNLPMNIMYAQQVLYNAELRGAKIIIDLDDDYLAIPEENMAYKAFASEEFQFIFRLFLEKAERVIVSTEYLKYKYEELCKNIFVLPNMIDMDWFNEKIRNVTPLKPKALMRGRARVAWGGGGLAHRNEFKYLQEIINITKKYDIELDIIGIDPLDLHKFEINWDCVNLYGFMPLQHYYRFVYHRNYDLMCAPLDDIEFNKSKSDIKILEAYALNNNCGCVCSNVEPYKGYKYAGMGLEEALSNIKELQEATKEYAEKKFMNKDLVRSAYANL